MKRVLFVNTNPVWGGGEKWHFQMAGALIERGYQVAIVGLTKSDLIQKAETASIPFFEFKVSNLSFLSVFKRRKARKILVDFSPDAVVVNLPRDVKLFVPLAKELTNTPKVIYRRGMPHPLKRNLINKLVYSKIDSFIANSKEIEASLIKNFPEFEPKVTVIYNGVTPMPPSQQFSSEKIILGNLGRLVPQKGQKYLIDLAIMLENLGVEFEIRIAGTGKLKHQLQSLIQEKNLSEKVKLLGYVNPEHFFDGIHLFIFTSQFEGSANALLESLQHGKPAICFNLSSNPEIIRDGHNGYLVEPNDVGTMANKIFQLKNNPLKLQELSQNAIHSIQENFQFQQKVEELCQLIK